VSLAFPPNVRLIRGCVIDYLSRDVPLIRVVENVRVLLSARELTLSEVLKVVDKVEDDPLCTPYISKAEKQRKLKQLRKALASLESLSEGNI
jgi:hypothetical protein